MLGFIVYRLPAPHELFGVPPENFDTYKELNFYLSVKCPDIFGEEIHLSCSSASKCRIRYHKWYTPVVQYIAPPVLYYESQTSIVFNPKSMSYVIRELKSDEMYFVNTEIAGSKLDFEEHVDYETSLRNWHDNHIIGDAGEMPVGPGSDIKMLWETGYAKVNPVRA